MFQPEQASPSSSASSCTWPSTGTEANSTSGNSSQSSFSNAKLSQATLPPSPPGEMPSQKWKRGRGFWRSFIAICIPLLLSALEGSITNTALPTIADALDLGTSYSWVATAFLLASTVLQPLYSQLGDMWGRKFPMMAVVAVFAVGSGICGAAKSGNVLILGRIVQGLGTGGIDLFAEMILCDIIPLLHRGRYLAIKHVTFAIGTTLGPLLGGVFSEHDWRWCFLINIPVCGISLVVIWFWLNVEGGTAGSESNPVQQLKKVDYIGSGILTASVIMILVTLSIGGASKPWSHPAIVVPLVLGGIGIVIFACWERCRYCKYPIIPPHIFSNRTTNIAFTLTTIHGFVVYGFQFYLPPYFQAVQGSSPTRSGIEVLPTTLVIVVLAAIGGPLLSIFGKYKPIHIVGFALMTLGVSLCVLLDANTPTVAWTFFQLIAAAGFGIVVPTMLPAVQVKLPESTTGVSAGSWAFLRGTGSLFGVAVPGAIFNARFAELLHTIPSEAARAELENGKAYSHATAKFTQRFGDEAKAQIVAVFTQALRVVWILFAVLAAIGFLLAWFEKQYEMRNTLETAYGLKKEKTASASVETPGEASPDLERGGGHDVRPCSASGEEVSEGQRSKDVVLQRQTRGDAVV